MRKNRVFTNTSFVKALFLLVISLFLAFCAPVAAELGFSKNSVCSGRTELFRCNEQSGAAAETAACAALERGFTETPEFVETSTQKYACKIASFYTTYGWSAEQRKHNVELAASRLDGAVLNPEEIFSFNAVVGARTLENGFLPAPVIFDGEYVEGVGGGVCQMSSTLYNAALLADLSVVCVKNHSLPVHYVNPSFDAMVSSASDLRLLNTRSSAVRLSVFCDGERVTVEVWGEPLGFSVRRVSVTVKELNFQTEYRLVEGVECGTVLKHGADGYISEGFLQYVFGGRVVKTVKIRRDVYYPQKRIIAS